MKIVWFSHTAELAGAELSLLEGARGLVAAGHQLHGVLPARGRLGELLQRAGASVSMIPYRWWIAAGAQRSPVYKARRLARNLAAWPRIRRLLDQQRPDLVVSNTLGIPVGALAARSLRIPHLWYVHELYGGDGHGLFFDLGERASLFLMDRLADRVMANSHVVQEQLSRRISPERIRVVYQAVEVPIPQATTERRAGAFRLVVVGRMTEDKRQIDAIRALSLLIERGLDLRLSLVGREEADYARRLRATVQELQVTDRVEFVPFTEDPFSRVLDADVALSCSRGESFGRVTVEAMKLGRPVVGADSAGTRELIQDGVTGFLYRLGDPEDLARKIAALHRDPELQRRMGDQARDWARERFSTARYTADLEQQFEEVVAGKAALGSGLWALGKGGR
jgi:glycosyltransferase involved in cell wall biosynthesis